MLLASMGTSRVREQCNRRTRKQIRNLRKWKTNQSPKHVFENNWKDCRITKGSEIGRGKYNRKQNCFSRKDEFSKNLIRQTVYSLQRKKTAPKVYAFE